MTKYQCKQLCKITITKHVMYLISDVSGYNNYIFYRNDLNKIASETKHKYRKLIDQKILKRQILKTTT